MRDGLTGGLVVIGVLVTVSLGAVATDRSSADATPTPLVAGQDLNLVFEIGGPGTAEVVVGEDVNCTVTFPDGSTRSPCDASGALVEVRQGEDDSRAYVFEYQAPDQVGNYDVLFEASSTAQVLPHDHSAQTSFRVLDSEEPDPAAGDPDDGAPGEDPEQDPPEEDPQDPEAGGDGDQGADGPEGSGDEAVGLASVDEARLAASTTVAVAVLLAGLVGIRT